MHGRVKQACLVGVASLLTSCQGIAGTEDGPLRPFNASLCSEPAPADNPIRRLTQTQYRRAVESIFPGVSLPGVTLSGNALAGAYENNAYGQPVSDGVIQQFADAAEGIATRASSDRSWLSCELENEGCLDEAVNLVASRAYRRSLGTEEASEYASFVAAQAPEFGNEDTLSMFIEGILQSPEFLYFPEVGDRGKAAPVGQLALSDEELAVRLSFFLWNQPPDDALLTATRSGALSTDEGILAEFDRMTADPRFESSFDEFFYSWLRLDTLNPNQVADPLIREPGVAADLIRSAQLFMRHALFEEGSLQAVFSSRRGYVNDRIAPLFGVPAPGSMELVPVELPESERAGILTHPAWLASTTHGSSHSPIFRGVFVLDRILCDRPPPPPPDVVDNTGTPGSGEIVTTRQRVEEAHGTGSCRSCHEAIDGMGFSFENYNAAGRFQTMENGVPVDPTGRLRGETVQNAVELGEMLGEDPGASLCFVRNVFEFALARSGLDGDRCQVSELEDVMTAERDFVSLLRALVTSNAFRNMPLAAGGA